MKFRRHAGLARRTGRRVDVDRQLGAVARRQIRVSVIGDRLVVDAGIPRRRGLRVDGDRARRFARGGQANPVAGSRRHVPEQQPSERVRVLRVHGRAARVQQRHLSIRGQAGDVHLLRAPLRGEGGRARGRHQPNSERHERRDDTDPRTTPKRRPCHQAATLSRAAHDPTISARSISTQQLSPHPRAHAQKLGPLLRSGPLVRHQLECARIYPCTCVLNVNKKKPPNTRPTGVSGAVSRERSRGRARLARRWVG